MAGFRKDKTTAAQTAANGAAEVTSALVTAGVITDADAAKAFHAELYAQTFEELGAVVEADNVVFAEAEASAPKSSGGSRKSGGSSKGGGSSSKPAGEVELIFGAFKGLTLDEVYDLSPEQAGEYNYPKADPGSKSGREYIVWLSKNEDEKASFIRGKALELLETKRAGSDE